MVAWQGSARVGGFIASVWAARCLGPENLGISAMVIATVTQVALLINLNQNNALVRSFKNTDDPEEQARLVHEAVSFRLFSSIAIALLALVGIYFIPHSPTWTLALVAGLPLLINECNQPMWVLQSRDLAPVIHRSSFVQSAVLLAGYALFMRPGAGAGTDLILTVVGAAFASVFGWAFALRHMARRPDWRAALRYTKHIGAGRWLIVSGVSNYIYNSSFVALVGYLVSVTDAGLFRVANTVAMQLSVITAIGQQLIFPRFIDLSRKDPVALRRWQGQITLMILAVAVPVTVAAAIGGRAALSLVFSPAFAPAATAFVLVIATRFFAAAASVYTFGLWAQSRDRQVAFSMSVLAVATLGFSFFIIPRYGVTGAGIAALFGETTSLLLNWAIARSTPSRVPIGKPARNTH